MGYSWALSGFDSMNVYCILPRADSVNMLHVNHMIFWVYTVRVFYDKLSLDTRTRCTRFTRSTAHQMLYALYTCIAFTPYL